MAYLQAANLSKIYRGGEEETVALKEATLRLERGEMAAIVGRSGSGKSTLMNLLGCLDLPTAGTYTLNGQEVSALSSAGLSALRNREIGFVFQQFHLIPTLDAVENVELPLLYRGMGQKERRRRAEECLEEVGLAGRLHHRPAQLSGGQQQRVAIARAMAGDPPLLLADEPTGNLDGESAARVMTILRRLNEAGHTVLLITHDEHLAASLPRRFCMEAGCLHGG